MIVTLYEIKPGKSLVIPDCEFVSVIAGEIKVIMKEKLPEWQKGTVRYFNRDVYRCDSAKENDY
jgi:hypothetical protein